MVERDYLVLRMHPALCQSETRTHTGRLPRGLWWHEYQTRCLVDLWGMTLIIETRSGSSLAVFYCQIWRWFLCCHSCSVPSQTLP